MLYVPSQFSLSLLYQLVFKTGCWINLTVLQSLGNKGLIKQKVGECICMVRL